ncbi:apolipoprotein N-acyltransferase [Arvimicrobium flavum]|uniref:apolipoprotein N-acyltransferase n=1 Tax=Arvimicrobium flavum TaxID=3393320 RepID=UPI00237B127F|nr:apolipoprotein N-acyltransferase [Mesorhizobium shangrilense]
MEGFAGRIVLLWGWRRVLTAFLAGALAALGQAPYDFFAVGFVSFPVLVWLLDGATACSPAGLLKRLRPAFATGWWFGFGYFVAGLWWVGGALLVEADAFAWALPLAVLGLPALLAVFFGLAAVLARLFWGEGVGRIAALAAAFGVAEWLRAVAFTGFPWNPVGYIAMPVPLLMQSVGVVGTMGMNVLAVFVFSMPALLAARSHRAAGAALAALLAVAHVGYGAWALSWPAPAGENKLSVRIVQPSIDQSEKWEGSVRDRIFKTLLDLSALPVAEGQPKPELILWPETSLPFLLTERPDALVAMGELLQPGQMLMAGIVREEGGAPSGSARYYNSVVAINDAGVIVDAVDKVHLVPFGEYLPFQDILGELGLQKVVTLPLDFAAGSARHAMTLPGGMRGVPFVCYEIIFPTLVAADTGAADVIINVTNDAWFGDTPGPYQHFRQAQIRAAESGLPVLRSANNGISGVIDARGRVVDALAIDARAVIDATVATSGQDRAIPVNPSLNGVFVLGFFVLFCVGFGVRSRFRSN